MPERHKGSVVGEPTIKPIGRYVKTHHRHFRQRSDFTICCEVDQNYGWKFGSHQEVFDRHRPGQDFLWKFDLPSTERLPVLRELSDYNLTAYTLFNSDESLMETLWLREHVLRKSNG